MTWQNTFKEGQKIVLTSASREGNPHAIIVVSLGFVDNKLLIGACQMKTTLENIKNNNQVALVTWDDSGYYRIEGCCEILSSGKYFESALVKSRPSLAKSAIVIDITSVFDLDKAVKIL